MNAAQSLEGSRDVGAQLFCAMLRSAGVDARLVCSLLPLPFQRAQKSVLSQAKQYAVVIPVPGSRESTPGNGSGVDAGSDGSVPRVRTISSNDRRVRFDQTKRSASPELSSSKLPVHIKSRHPEVSSLHKI